MAKYISKLINGEELYYLKDSEARENKADKSATVSTVSYDTTNKKITKTINGTKSDVVTTAKLKSDMAITKSDVGLSSVTNDAQVKRTEMGAASGVATLDSNGKVPSSQLPSYVDDVIEGYFYNSKFYKESAHTTEITGETGKIYVDLSTNKTYRWGGSAYAVISETLALGETSSTAYRGDRGKTAYTHSQTTSGNPHNVTKSDVGLGNVGNFKAVSTVASQGLTDTEKSNARTNIGAGTSSFSGSYNDLSNKPTIPSEVTESTVSGWGFTKNAGTITGIKMNGASKGTSGVVDLGTVITAHLDISGKADKSATVSSVAYDTTSKKITKTINGTTSDVVTAAKIVTDGGGITSHQDISGKADKATTLAGYGITDAKIANGVITIGSNSITPLTSFSESDPVFTASAASGITSSDISNWNSKTSNVGTITGITMNGASKGTSGVVNLGTVITAHQDISGKVDKTTTVNGHALNGNVTVSKSDVGLGNVTNDAQVKRSEMGAISGVATLDSAGKVPASQLPSYVDDVLEYDTKSAFPTTGEAGKIYVDKSTNTSWRWSGTAYVQIKGDLAIGTTTGTAADGGVANTHYNNTSNPHSVTKAQVGLGSVVNTGDSATPVSGGTTKFTTGGAYTELAKKVDKVSGKGLSTNDYTTDEKNKLSGIASGAEVNQNAFSNVGVKVGNTTTTVAADAKTDTVTLIQGSNVTLTADTTNDTVTIAAKDTTYSAATTSAAGLMSADDKTKLNGIAAGAEVNVQSDWNATSGDAAILNKPTIPAAVAVKGNAETSYRTGNVNITPANIGLGNVNNTADANKSVASAAKLTTARNIWGQSFDGTADVSGDITVGNGNIILNNLKHICSKDIDGVVRGILRLNSTNNSNVLQIGSGLYTLENSKTNIYGGGNGINFCVAGTSSKMIINSSGNVGIGTASPSHKLSVNGNVKASSSVTASSFVKNGGTSSQFLKADGSVDSNSYALAMTSTIAVTSNVSSSCGITGDGKDGMMETIIYTNATTSDYVVTVPTTYKTPTGAALELTCPAGGYCEVSYINIDGTIYARGA